MRRLATLALFALLVPSAVLFADAAATAPATDLFDPARHMRVSEVTPGMTGYGLSVFKGTTIERFNVEVLSVLRDFNPQYDVVLVRLSGANLEHTGSIAGMSGSPIYLKDKEGRERMIGAFAYGWPLMKDPVGGVQPVEYMLKLQHREHPSTTRPGALPTTQISGSRADAGLGTSWDVSNSFVSFDTMLARARTGVDDDNVTRMRPLATPLMTAGLSPKIIEQLTPLMKAYGMVPLQAGGSGGGSRNPVDAKLEPGSVLAVPLLTGDVEMTAVGTCTEVLGDRVFGFGHPFNNEGPIALPVGGGEIHGVIANLMTSFKLGALGKTWGTLDADEQVGVAGQLGVPPPMIPIDLDVKYTDGSGERKYHFDAAWHTRFTPLLSAAAMTAAVTGVHDLPEFHTLDFDVTIEFANGEKVHLANDLVNASMPELFFEVGVPMMAAAQNPFERVSVKKVTGTVKITPEAHEATILWVNAPRLKFRPGETLKAYVNYRPFRASDAILPVEFDLPRDLPEGTYQLVISGWEQFVSDEKTAKPFRFDAESVSDVFAVLRDIASFRHDAVYMRLVRQPDGIAIGRTAMPNLPSSRREVLLGAGRSNTTPFVSSTTKIIKTSDLMSGSAEFEVIIDKNAHVETGVGKPPRHESTPTPPALAPGHIAPQPPKTEPPAAPAPAEPPG
jgi:hypothetical protein